MSLHDELLTSDQFDDIRFIHRSFELSNDKPPIIACLACCLGDDRLLTNNCYDNHAHTANPNTICDVARLLTHIKAQQERS